MIILILMISIIYFLHQKKMTLYYFIGSYNKSLQDFLFKWNKIYFNSKNLNVECPLSLDYILINLNYKEYEIWIQSHNF